MFTSLRRAAVAAAVVSAVAPAAARAEAPGVTTGGAARVTQTSATLTGQVNPRGERAVYFFEYGTTTRYTARTPDFPAGEGRSAVTAAANLDGLTPATRYQYRLVARNRSGTTRGANRSFRTPDQPLGVTLVADANPVRFGDPATIRGTVTGTGNAGQPVVLQARPFPFTTPFGDVAGPVPSDPAGNFVFSPVALGATTQYRVRLANRPQVDSPVLSLGVAVRVATYARRTVRRGGLLQFSGTIRPARPGAQVGIQKRNSRGGWSIVAGTITRGGDEGLSRFRKRVRVPRGGTYRVLVAVADGNLTSGTGSEIRIRTR
jgi:hypothetical protein